ncbi:MAG: hypothetical protein JWQ27_2481 [Ferruginibacter sp.]|nr:hypothetical protein [Ferruginibacter sp.]
MKQHSFDEHIKSQFSGYQPEVPPEIWEKIMARKEKRRPFGFWFQLLQKPAALIALVAILGGGAALYFSNRLSNPSSTTNTTANENTGTNKTPADQLAIGMPVNQEDHTIAETGKNLKPDNTTGSNSTSPVLDDNNLLPGRSKRTSTIARENSTDKSTVSYVKDDDDIKTEMNTDRVLSSAFYLQDSAGYFHLQSATRHDLQLREKQHLNFFIPCPTIEENAAGNKRYFELYAGPDYIFRTFSDTGSSAYAQKRKEFTSVALAYSVGLRYTKVFNNGMSVRAGINYSQVNEKLEYKSGSIVQTVYLISNTGDTTGSYTITGTQYKSSTNKYRTLDIPLLIGYELGNGRLHANINAGPVVNIHSWQKGYLPDYNNDLAAIGTGKNNSPYQFRSNIGVGFMGAVSVYYKLNEQLHLLAEPYFRYNVSPASKPEITFKQHNNIAGLRLGIRVDL